MTTMLEQFQVVCCDCGKTRVGDAWFDIDEVEVDGVQFTHGYCPVCFEKALMTLGRMADVPGFTDGVKSR